MGGANGTKENLPVGIEVLLEMAGYCERVYDDGEEIDDAQWFSAENMPSNVPPANISISGKLIENFINRN